MFLSVSFPVAKSVDYITQETEFAFGLFKNGRKVAWAAFPVKFGYRYTFNRWGNGFYAEPQFGFNIYGRLPESADPIHGLAYAAGGGYLFKILGTDMDVGLRFSSVVSAKSRPINYISIKLAKNLIIGD